MDLVPILASKKTARALRLALSDLRVIMDFLNVVSSQYREDISDLRMTKESQGMRGHGATGLCREAMEGDLLSGPT
jgi:hypothetical protein